MSPAAQAAVRAAGQKPRAHPALDRLQWFLLAAAVVFTICAIIYFFAPIDLGVYETAERWWNVRR